VVVDATKKLGMTNEDLRRRIHVAGGTHRTMGIRYPENQTRMNYMRDWRSYAKRRSTVQRFWMAAAAIGDGEDVRKRV